MAPKTLVAFSDSHFLFKAAAQAGSDFTPVVKTLEMIQQNSLSLILCMKSFPYPWALRLPSSFCREAF